MPEITFKRRTAHSDGKVYFSYAQIHEAICSLVPQIRTFEPAIMIAIGGGGYIPARILRTELNIPLLTVSVELYNDATCTRRDQVKKIQWFDTTFGTRNEVYGKRILIVDEVDDSRTTFKYVVDEVVKTIQPSAVAVAVVHNKLKPKNAELPEDVLYLAGENVEDYWNCYPWDAGQYGHNIWQHEELAMKCAGEKDDKDTTIVGGLTKHKAPLYLILVSFIAGLAVASMPRKFR